MALKYYRRLRQVSVTPVLMLTARGEEFDRVLGLELGADDYLTKSFSLHELIAGRNPLLQKDVDVQSVLALPNELEVIGIEMRYSTHHHNGFGIPANSGEFQNLLSLPQTKRRTQAHHKLGPSIKTSGKHTQSLTMKSGYASMSRMTSPEHTSFMGRGCKS